MYNVTVQYGLTKKTTLPFAPGSTVRDVLGNAAVKIELGYPENVHALDDGVRLDLGSQVYDGQIILLEKQAAAKAL